MKHRHQDTYERVVVNSDVGPVVCWRVLMPAPGRQTPRAVYEVSASRVGVAVFACRANGFWVWDQTKMRPAAQRRLAPLLSRANRQHEALESYNEIHDYSDYPELGAVLPVTYTPQGAW